MDSARVGALFFHAVEDLVRANDIVLTLQLREPMDEEALCQAYARQVRARPTLASTLQLEPVGAGHGWETLDRQRLEALLEQQLADMVSGGPESPEVFQPTNSVLPYRVRLIDPLRLEVRISHLLTNGQGALFWANDLLAMLAGELAGLPQATRAPARWRRCASALRETFWSLAWTATYLAAAGRHAAARTVDLSHGREPLPMGGGFLRARRVLSAEDSRTLVGAARQQGRRVSSVLLSALSAELLAARPEKDQVCVVMPDDLLAARPNVARSDPGNHTGALLARLRRGSGHRGAGFEARDHSGLANQADAAFRWARRGVVAGATRLADLAARDEHQLRQQLRDAAARPLTARGPFESASCVLSNMGARREFPRLSSACEWITVTSFGQPPILSALDISGRVAFELSASNDLFDGAEMERLLDGFVGRLP